HSADCRSVTSPRRSAVRWRKPPPPIRAYIVNALSASAQPQLTLGDLVEFVLKEGVDVATSQVPEVGEFLAMIGPALAPAGAAAAVLLRNSSAVLTNAQGQVDEQATLDALRGALSTFIAARFEQNIVPMLTGSMGSSPDAKELLDEVLLPSIRAAIDVVLARLLEWDSGTVSETALREMVSSIVTMVLGRSVVATADILISTAQEQLYDLLNDAADKIGQSGLVQLLRPLTGAGSAEEIS